ncbi:MFS transporter [Sphingomonas sp.]|uniref:MFS transporter n=1 Tax=Sphingomonas sp. TaxID=28214 RepID=UPI001EBE19DB|nr:MFS transporter [Sphingomonas sp.]MBX3594357.1 MFS transporter [Sphingomonas sp.]
MEKNASWYRWYVVVLLLLVFVLSYFDRYILSLLVEPIKKSMNLSDFQIGLLLGPAFSLFNVVVMIPLGVLADRANRKWLLVVGIVIWCTMTAMSGFAMSFLPLLLFRFGLGLGEAVVSPCSVSIISDYFGRKERARAISLYMAGPYLGAGLAFLAGGALVSMLHESGPVDLGIHTFQPWQLAFLLVGIPGFVFALLMLTVREPVRTERIGPQGGAQASAVRYMLERWRGFGVLTLGATCNFAMSTLTLWNVPLFQRVHGWSVVEIGAVTGLFYFTAGPIGTALALWASKALGKGKEDSAMRVLILGLFITVPASALYPILPSPELAVVAMFIAFIGKSTATAGGPAALQMITPGEMRSRSVAIFNTVIMLVGPLLGPPLIGAVTDWMGTPKAIGVALSGFVIVVGVPTLLVVCFGLKHYRALAAQMAGTLDNGGTTGGEPGVADGNPAPA